MLYFGFENYNEFKDVFGIRVFDGRKERKNKILLAFLKDKNVWEWCRSHDNMNLLRTCSMGELVASCWRMIDDFRAHGYELHLNGHYYYSPTYRTDQLQGVCEDGSAGYIRYINTENDRVFKMKAGKMCRHIIETNEFGKVLPEQIKNYMCEEFARDWQAYAMTRCPKYTLHIGSDIKDFKDIYSCDRVRGNFHSCMMDEDNHSFYVDAVKARAAYLTNDYNEIVARCVIFDEVRDVETGETFRFAERQYSTECDPVLQQALITALINAEEIDIYKKVGAGCGDCRAIVDINGNSMSDRCFEIECNLEGGDRLSYQDTFKWYDTDTHIADNYGNGDIDLATTDGWFEAAYDDWHDRYCRETVTVYYHGREYQCDADELDEFDSISTRWGSEYVHKDDVVECQRCGERLVLYYDEYDDMGMNTVHPCEYADDGDYCEDCAREVDDEWKEEHGWKYSEYDDEWVDPDEDDVVEWWKPCANCNKVNDDGTRDFVLYFLRESIRLSTLESLIARDRAEWIDDVAFERTTGSYEQYDWTEARAKVFAEVKEESEAAA